MTIHRIKQIIRDNDSITLGLYLAPAAALGVWLGYVLRFGYW